MYTQAFGKKSGIVVATIVSVIFCGSLQAAVARNLHEAAESGNLARVKQLLDEDKAKIDVRNEHGDTLLNIAARNGDTVMVQELLLRQANAKLENNDGWTPLHEAAWHGYKEMVIELCVSRHISRQSRSLLSGLIRGVVAGGFDRNLVFNVNITTHDGRTPLYLAAEENHKDVIEELCKLGAQHTLFTAAMVGDVGLVRELCTQSTRINAANRRGHTPLYLAARSGNRDTVAELCRRGADVNKQSERGGVTPICIAARNGHRGVVAELCKWNADVNAGLPLHAAAGNGHKDVVIELCEWGADINATDNDNCTPLSVARRMGHREVEEFLDNPEHITQVQAIGELISAAKSGNLEVLQRLIEQGADLNVAIQCDGSITPLHVAARNGHNLTCHALLLNGARQDLQDGEGKTSIDYAIEVGTEDTELWSDTAHSFQVLWASECDEARNIAGNYFVRVTQEGSVKKIKDIFEYFSCQGQGEQIDALVNFTSRMNRMTPLHVAVCNGRNLACYALLLNGARLGLQDSDGKTPIDYAIESGTEGTELWSDKANSFQMLWRSYRNEARQIAGDYFIRIVQEGRIKEVKALLECFRSQDREKQICELINSASGKVGKTPLHCAVECGHLKMVKALVKYGASPDIPDSYKRTPLDYVLFASYSEEKKTKLLKSMRHATPTLFFVFMTGKYECFDQALAFSQQAQLLDVCDPSGKSPLYYAAENIRGDLPIDDQMHLVHELCVAGCHVDGHCTAQGDRHPPIAIAAYNGNAFVVRQLLDVGADQNVSVQGATALSIAVQRDKPTVAALLASKGAHISEDVLQSTNDAAKCLELISNQGRCPLQAICELGTWKNLSLFIQPETFEQDMETITRLLKEAGAEGMRHAISKDIVRSTKKFHYDKRHALAWRDALIRFAAGTSHKALSDSVPLLLTEEFLLDSIINNDRDTVRLLLNKVDFSNVYFVSKCGEYDSVVVPLKHDDLSQAERVYQSVVQTDDEVRREDLLIERPLHFALRTTVHSLDTLRASRSLQAAGTILCMLAESNVAPGTPDASLLERDSIGRSPHYWIDELCLRVTDERERTHLCLDMLDRITSHEYINRQLRLSMREVSLHDILHDTHPTQAASIEKYLQANTQACVHIKSLQEFLAVRDVQKYGNRLKALVLSDQINEQRRKLYTCKKVFKSICPYEFDLLSYYYLFTQGETQEEKRSVIHALHKKFSQEKPHVSKFKRISNKIRLALEKKKEHVLYDQLLAWNEKNIVPLINPEKLQEAINEQLSITLENMQAALDSFFEAYKALSRITSPYDLRTHMQSNEILRNCNEHAPHITIPLRVLVGDEETITELQIYERQQGLDAFEWAQDSSLKDFIVQARGSKRKEAFKKLKNWYKEKYGASKRERKQAAIERIMFHLLNQSDHAGERDETYVVVEKSPDSITLDEVYRYSPANKIKIEYFADLLEHASLHRLPRCILLAGPSGCGKSMTARALAHETRYKLLEPAQKHFIRNRLIPGGADKALKQLFSQIDDETCTLVFIGNIDTICCKEEDGPNISAPCIQMLRVLSEHAKRETPVVFVATTHNEQMLDPDIVSLFYENIVHIPYPNKRERKLFLATLLSEVPWIEQTDDFFEIASEMTKEFSYRELEQLANVVKRNYQKQEIDERIRHISHTSEMTSQHNTAGEGGAGSDTEDDEDFDFGLDEEEHEEDTALQETGGYRKQLQEEKLLSACKQFLESKYGPAKAKKIFDMYVKSNNQDTFENLVYGGRNDGDEESDDDEDSEDNEESDDGEDEEDRNDEEDRDDNEKSDDDKKSGDISALKRRALKLREFRNAQGAIGERERRDRHEGIILYGPPGTGKTSFARAFANEAGYYFLSKGGDEFVASHIGEGAQRVRDFFQLAKSEAPCVVFIDEVDSIAVDRNDGKISQEKKITLNAFLTAIVDFIDEGHGVIIVATNLIDKLDSAFKNRFSTKIKIGAPNKKDAEKIIGKHLKKLIESWHHTLRESNGGESVGVEEINERLKQKFECNGDAEKSLLIEREDGMLVLNKKVTKTLAESAEVSDGVYLTGRSLKNAVSNALRKSLDLDDGQLKFGLLAKALEKEKKDEGREVPNEIRKIQFLKAFNRIARELNMNVDSFTSLDGHRKLKNLVTNFRHLADNEQEYYERVERGLRRAAAKSYLKTYEQLKRGILSLLKEYLDRVKDQSESVKAQQMSLFYDDLKRNEALIDKFLREVPLNDKLVTSCMNDVMRLEYGH